VAGDGPLNVNRYRQFRNIISWGAFRPPQTLTLLSGARATVIPSRSYDVLPQVLIESYRAATPVIAPRTGSFPELIQNKETGLMYDGLQGLKRAVSYAAKNPRILSLWGKAARRAYEKQFHPLNHYRVLMEIYRKAMV
jgi:glycosyltransferase involved in cell wall biosynthesis